MPHRLSRLLPVLALALMLPACAAQRHLDAGRAALESGRPVLARQQLEDALRLKPKLIDRPAFAADLRLARRDAALLEGRQALEHGRSNRAIARFETALALDATLTAARDGLARAHHQAADTAYQQAVTAADAGDTDATRSALDTALRHRSGHPQARVARTSLADPPANPPPAFDEAGGHRAARDWERAAQAYDDCVRQHPAFLRARIDRQHLPAQAAADLIAQARQATEANQLADAHGLLERAAAFKPHHADLPSAHAHLHLTHAGQLQTQDRLGAALLAARTARRHHDTPAARSALGQLTTTLRQRHAFALRPLTAAGADTDAALLEQTHQHLQQTPAAALTFDPQAATGWTLHTAPAAFDAVTVRHAHKKHAYKVEHQIPNPKLPGLHRELDHSASCILGLAGRESRLCGDLLSVQHRQSTWIHRQKKHHDPHTKDDHKHNPHHAYSVCNPHDAEVRRLQRRLSRLRHELAGAQADHARIGHAIRRTPQWVTAHRTEYHPYREAQHRQKARQQAQLTPLHPGAATLDAQATAHHEDRTLDGARPDLGLPHDPLHLLSETQLRQQLRRQLAAKLARQLVQHTVEARRADLHADNTAESRVAAAVLLSATSKPHSEAELDAQPLPPFGP